jgi:hypothetical protein
LFFVLNYKTIPVSYSDFGYVFKYEIWEPTLTLDRTELAEVFKAIIARLFDVGKKAAPRPAPAAVPMSNASVPAPADVSVGLSTR